LSAEGRWGRWVIVRNHRMRAQLSLAAKVTLKGGPSDVVHSVRVQLAVACQTANPSSAGQPPQSVSSTLRRRSYWAAQMFYKILLFRSIVNSGELFTVYPALFAALE